jgi:hypothetical protein
MKVAGRATSGRLEIIKRIEDALRICLSASSMRFIENALTRRCTSGYLLKAARAAEKQFSNGFEVESNLLMPLLETMSNQIKTRSPLVSGSVFNLGDAMEGLGDAFPTPSSASPKPSAAFPALFGASPKLSIASPKPSAASPTFSDAFPKLSDAPLRSCLKPPVCR